MAAKKPTAFEVEGVCQTKCTDFRKELPEYGEFLIWDFYANGDVQNVVKVVKVRESKGYFVIEDGRKVRLQDGKAEGFTTAIVRRDREKCKELRRQMAERRLMYFDFDKLPGKILRQMNRILDDYEISREEMKARYAISKEEIKNSVSQYRGTEGGRKKSTDSKPQARSSLDDAPKKTSWGRKKSSEDD